MNKQKPFNWRAFQQSKKYLKQVENPPVRTAEAEMIVVMLGQPASKAMRFAADERLDEYVASSILLCPFEQIEKTWSEKAKKFLLTHPEAQSLGFKKNEAATEMHGDIVFGAAIFCDGSLIRGKERG